MSEHQAENSPEKPATAPVIDEKTHALVTFGATAMSAAAGEYAVAHWAGEKWPLARLVDIATIGMGLYFLNKFSNPPQPDQPDLVRVCLREVGTRVNEQNLCDVTPEDSVALQAATLEQSTSDYGRYSRLGCRVVGCQTECGLMQVAHDDFLMVVPDEDDQPWTPVPLAL